MTSPAAAAPLTLTGKQRAKIIAQVQQDPSGCGHVAAARAAGVEGSRGQIRTMLAADEQFQDALAEARRQNLARHGLDEQSLLAALGEIVADRDNASRLRAVQWVAGVFHGWAAAERLEVTGADGGPMEVTNPDVAAAIDRFAAQLRLLARRDEPSRDLRDAAPARAAIPARTAGG